MPATASWISRRKHPDGMEACVRDTNINVWGLVLRRQRGQHDDAIMAAIQGLTPADLESAWEYYQANPQEIDEAIGRNSSEE